MILDILMTSYYSNALSSSNDKLCTADSTFNNNSSDSENSNKITNSTISKTAQKIFNQN